MRIYVASSWRNDYQPDAVRALREVDHEVYDFRNPAATSKGFHWSQIDPAWREWGPLEFIDGLNHPLAEQGFAADIAAMKRADACVLVMPCGRSAHLKAGFFVGAGKPLLILLSDGEPKLMYRMADGLFSGMGPLLLRLQKIEDGDG